VPFRPVEADLLAEVFVDRAIDGLPA